MNTSIRKPSLPRIRQRAFCEFSRNIIRLHALSETDNAPEFMLKTLLNIGIGK